MTILCDILALCRFCNSLIFEHILPKCRNKSLSINLFLMNRINACKDLSRLLTFSLVSIYASMFYACGDNKPIHTHNLHNCFKIICKFNNCIITEHSVHCFFKHFTKSCNIKLRLRFLKFYKFLFILI